MMVDHRILEAIDCCRPGSDDLQCADLHEAAQEVQSQPQLAELQQRIERFDSHLRTAMDDVPVPEGLAARLLAGVSQSSSDPDQPTTELSAMPETKETAPAATSGRWWAAAALAVAASVAVAVTAVWMQRDAAPIALETLERDVEQWHETVWADDQWNTSLAEAPASHPPADRVRAVPRRWRSLATTLDKRTVAYDLTPPGSRHRATLYVSQTQHTVAGLAPFPPVAPQSTTGGRSLAVWQDNSGLLYVLVVEGPRRRYHDLVDTRTGPLI